MSRIGEIKEKIETIIYNIPSRDSGDLEAGTHTIVPTSRPAIGAAQYSKSLTLAKPPDARLEVKRIAVRLNVNIAGLGTATHVYCSVRVDVDDADHELFSEDWTSIGSKLDAVDTHSGAKSTIFNLLKDGAAHTFYFLFWADVANQATIDLVELWEGAGSCSTTTHGEIVATLTFDGLLSVAGWHNRYGTGTSNFEIGHTGIYTSTGIADYGIKLLLVHNCDFRATGTVATDINTFEEIDVILRSEQ